MIGVEEYDGIVIQAIIFKLLQVVLKGGIHLLNSVEMVRPLLADGGGVRVAFGQRHGIRIVVDL